MFWFDGRAEETTHHYVSVFPSSRIGTVSHCGEGMPLPADTALLVELTLNGQRFQTLNGTPEFVFSPAVSLSVPCVNKAEVDHYWAALTADGGSPEQCGWVTDRFGVSWQIVPAALGRMLADGPPKQVQRMMMALTQMSKLDAAALEAAFAG